MAPSHYLNQCWHTVNKTPRNIFQWNFIWNSNIFIQENAFEHVLYEMATVLSGGDELNLAWQGFRHFLMSCFLWGTHYTFCSRWRDVRVTGLDIRERWCPWGVTNETLEGKKVGLIAKMGSKGWKNNLNGSISWLPEINWPLIVSRSIRW